MYHNHIHSDVNAALPKLMRHVLEEGDEVGSRLGERTLELTMVGTTLTHPWRRETLLPSRKVDIAAQIAETMWVLAGRNDVEFLQHYLPRAAEFADDGKHWRGGYGPRLRGWEDGVGMMEGETRVVDQLAEVVKLLKGSVGTRRAVMNIFDPAADFQDSKDIPCNNWLSFISRLGKLDLHVAIRSNDLMWGWSGINQFEWSVLQEVVAGLLGLQVGGLHFSTTSLHLYDRHWAKAFKIAHDDVWVPPIEDSPRFNPAHGTTLAGFDALVKRWFQLEYDIRESSEDSWQQILDFPEPMMRSWLMVLAWWWSGDRMFLEPLEGTRLEAATHYSVQPKTLGDAVASFLRPKREMTDRCPKCGEGKLSTSGGRTPLKCIRAVCNYVIGSDEQVDTGNGAATAPEPSEFITAATALHCEKHASYGDSWKKRGEMLGIMANIARKIDRLGKGETSDETSADTAMDLMVYLAKYQTWLMDEADLVVEGEGASDDPHAANQILFEIDTSYPPISSTEAVEAGLRTSFDYLERLVTAGDAGVHSQVRTMTIDAYRLARTLWEREQGPAVRNATRSWNPEQDDDRGKVQQAHPASAPGWIG